MGTTTPPLPDLRGQVTSVTNATPMVVTVGDAHGLRDQDEVKISGVRGNAAANGSYYVKITGYDAKSFALYQDKKLEDAVAASGTYEAGGKVYEPFKSDYAIVVGINRYPEFRALEGPERDATTFRDWLISPTGGMVQSENVKLILSSQYDPGDGTFFSAKPALSDLKGEFDRLRTKAYKVLSPKYRIGRRLYMFLSGHGITPAGAPSPNLDDAALLMANASSNALDNHFPGHPYAEWFRNAAAFDEIVLLMDCCRDLKNNVSSIGPTPALISEERKDSVRRFYAVATELDSSSWEQPLGNPKQAHGVFSYVVMEGLQNEAVCDVQGRLTGYRLKTYLESRLPEIRKDQVARIFPPPDPNNDIVFIARRQVFKPNLLISFTDATLQGNVVQLIDGSRYDAPPDVHTINSAPWELRKPNGFYKLKIEGGPSKGPWELDGSQEVNRVDFP